MKVLMVQLDKNRGGIETFIINTLKYLSKEGISFDVFMNGSNEDIEKNVIGQIIHLPKNMFRRILIIYKTIHDGKYDIIHVNKNSNADILIAMIARIYSRHSKLVLHSHNTQPSNSNMLFKVMHYINRPYIRHISDKMLACSDLASDWLFGKNTHSEIIHNGIEISKYRFNKSIRANVRNRLGIDPDEMLIGNVGRLSKQKNQSFLIDILKSLMDKDVKARLIICGDGNERAELEKYAEEKNLKDKIIFYGNCKDVYNVLQAMDIFVMPSLYEGLTFAAVEAQCAGLPCLFSCGMSAFTKICRNTRFLSLSEGEIRWAEEILNMFRGFNRVDTSLEIQKAGYDVEQSSKKILKIYQELMG